MDLDATIVEIMVASFANVEDLMEYACIYGIQESPLVKKRLLELRQLHSQKNENQEGDFGSTRKSVLDPNLRDVMKAYLLDEEMNELTQACIDDGDWDAMADDRSSELQYTMIEKSVRTYAKNAAVDKTYTVKLDNKHKGQKLQDIQRGLHRMFDDVLSRARDRLTGNDLGRVVVNHEGLSDPIVAPLQKLDNLNSETVMSTIEKVLNSHQELSINQSLDITIGSIDLPKGSGNPRRCRITRIKGSNNSLQLKKSVVVIENDDQLCMARAIGVAWAKLNRCTKEEWKAIVKTRHGKSNLELALQHKKVPKTFYDDICKKNKKQQQQLARVLSQKAGIPLDRPASLDDVGAFEEILGVRIMVISSRLGNKFITSTHADERPCIYIYLVNEDHFHAITSITGFFSTAYFCVKCFKHYTNRHKHRCEPSCIVCKNNNCIETMPMFCLKCNMTCRSKDCYDRHIQEPKSSLDRGQCKVMPQCQSWWKCRTCFKVIKLSQRKKEDHRCGEHLCKACQQYVLNDHQCYLRATPYKAKLNSNFIFFDFECSQDEISTCEEGYAPTRCLKCTDENRCPPCKMCQNCKASRCGRSSHRPNFVVAHTVCKACINEDVTPESRCTMCGTRCEGCQKADGKDEGPCLGTCGSRQVLFEGDDAAIKFCSWAFSDQHECFKIVAHNMKGYDGYFLLEYLIDNSIRPDKIIYSGSKIMYMSVDRGLNITVIDSLNFLPMKLSALPKAFGLKELKKGWFPHYFNTKENQHYVGHYPDSRYYGSDFMGTTERQEFQEWYQKRKDEIFDFRKEMEEYCCSDVQILRQACLKFRQLMINATETTALVTTKKGKEKMKRVAVDPFEYSTIASVSMGLYRTKHLEEEWRVKLNDDQEWSRAKFIDGNLEVWHDNQWIKEGNLKDKVTKKQFIKTPIARVSPKGYNENYSRASIEWLEWISKEQGIHIQHALNLGEKTLSRYKLDGYCEATNTAFEYHGCVYHGCLTCFPVDREETKHPFTDQSMAELYALTMKKKSYIESIGMKYRCIWEHEFKQQRQQNQNLERFLASIDVTARLDPRDSFFGGRTNACRLYYKVQENEKNKYVDFTSLYPWVNKYCKYPVGHPQISNSDFKDIFDYFGIAKIKILPPRGLYHPILPYRSNGKLKFPLCRTCADRESSDPCSCSHEERSMTGTWCTPEIQEAVRMGYRIQKIYEVYHWQETTQYDPKSRDGGLFAKYINTFLKFKQEASGQH